MTLELSERLRSVFWKSEPLRLLLSRDWLRIGHFHSNEPPTDDQKTGLLALVDCNDARDLPPRKLAESDNLPDYWPASHR
jgi:hypothetical protein